MPISGAAVAAGTAGVILLYSAVKGMGVLATVRDVVSGRKPPAVTSTVASGNSSGGGAAGPVAGGSDAQNQALGRNMASAYSTNGVPWSQGAEWAALNWIAEDESGWSDTAANPTSNARGIAQNINGWSADYQEGDAGQQIAWMLNYIQGRYGDPVAAKAFHVANGYY